MVIYKIMNGVYDGSVCEGLFVDQITAVTWGHDEEKWAKTKIRPQEIDILQ